MLKKQTVWLLTMLSLMIVLSVYYLNAPNEGDLAFVDSEEQQNQTASSSAVEQMDELVTDEMKNVTEEGNVEELDTSSINSNEYFTAVRMEITNKRSIEKERLEGITASSESSSEEVNEAYEAMKEIEMLNEKESILEETIKVLNGYEQVLVRNVSDNNVVVTVQTDSLSATEANEIIQHAKDEFGEIKIDVVYQAS
ncbi:stage III sporulation protein AH [Gracilibacillus boraciitolerans JCM 21714]|uniref:Stage III sporulation protein AH n=1 Tax=Gracilibacillus boraciitolerans JCM 21714 TaxID=1298598 RepID=W4VER0_9BACI|nr:SpoIIIAH-like family protein [Gracilibacillus boraciitolerans]GAE91244.1 stage III sporulation protein AH [Gracilibacillus boraciitolerans JCM 21714]